LVALHEVVKVDEAPILEADARSHDVGKVVVVAHAEKRRVLELTLEYGDVVASVIVAQLAVCCVKQSQCTISQLHRDSEEQAKVFLQHVFPLLVHRISD